jgi:hypothetical protein
MPNCAVQTQLHVGDVKMSLFEPRRAVANWSGVVCRKMDAADEWWNKWIDHSTHAVLEFAAALSSLCRLLFLLGRPRPWLGGRGLDELRNLLLDGLVVQPLECDLLLLSVAWTGVSCVSGVGWVWQGSCWRRRTVSCVEGRLEAAGLADEDGGVGVVLLHGGVAALEEGAAARVSVCAGLEMRMRLEGLRWRMAGRWHDSTGSCTVSRRCARWSGRTGSAAP